MKSQLRTCLSFKSTEPTRSFSLMPTWSQIISDATLVAAGRDYNEHGQSPGSTWRE